MGDHEERTHFPDNNLTILPISGGACPFQMGIMCKLCDWNYDTGVMFGASGGNIAAYIAHAANFQSEEIRRISLMLKPEMFCSNWNEMMPSLSIVQGQINGSWFNKGSDNTLFLQDCFETNYGTREDPQTREIWTAAYNSDMKRTSLFCNKDPHTSVLQNINLDYDVYKIDPPSYACGDLNKINSIIAASAAIPCVVPPVKINGYNMQDAGLSCASPMFIIGDLFKGLSELHMFYIGCENLDKTYTKRVGSMGFREELMETRNTVVYNTMCNDRRKCYEVLTCGSGVSSCQIEDIRGVPFNEEGWEVVKEIRANSRKSLVEIFPTECESINMVSFTPKEFDERMRFAEANSRMNIWYIEK